MLECCFIASAAPVLAEQSNCSVNCTLHDIPKSHPTCLQVFQQCAASSLQATHDVQLMQHDSVAAIQGTTLFKELLAGLRLAMGCDPGQHTLPTPWSNDTGVHLASIDIIR